MEFHFIDFRDAGFVFIQCDCGAEYEDLGDAIDHVANAHFTEEDRRSEISMLDRVAYLISPNPVVLEI